MEFKLYWFEGIRKHNSVARFMQAMCTRLLQGEFRYGAPNKRQRYFSRLKLEVEAYEKTGNQEHLINIANYCWLETEQPQHKKAHHDATVDSVTRGRIR